MNANEEPAPPAPPPPPAITIIPIAVNPIILGEIVNSLPAPFRVHACRALCCCIGAN